MQYVFYIMVSLLNVTNVYSHNVSRDTVRSIECACVSQVCDPVTKTIPSVSDLVQSALSLTRKCAVSVIQGVSRGMSRIQTGSMTVLGDVACKLSTWMGSAKLLPAQVLLSAAARETEHYFKDRHPGVLAQPEAFRGRPLYMRRGNDLCPQEQEALAHRKEWVRNGVMKQCAQIGIPCNDADADITVSALFSGGGYRAMIMTLGWLAGLEQEGLLDTVSWTATLSGSTWGLGAWYARQTDSVLDARETLFNRIAGTELFDIEHDDVSGTFLEALSLPLLFNNQPNIADLYGAALTRRILQKPYEYLSNQAEFVASGKVPLPIYTAIMPHQDDYKWFEFTPWEIGSSWIGAYCPTGGYGRYCYAGATRDDAPQRTFGFQLGVFGSAYGISLREVVTHGYFNTIKSVILRRVLAEMVMKEFGDFRIPTVIPNYVYGMRGVRTSHTKDLEMVDAGIDFNLPFPPVSGQRHERMPDILLFFDASGGNNLGKELCHAWKYARKHGLPFPTKSSDGCDLEAMCMALDTSGAQNETMCLRRAITIFEQEGAPTVIYIPRVNDPSLWAQLDERQELKLYDGYVRSCPGSDPAVGFDIDKATNHGFANTFNFTYTREQLDQLSGLAEFQVRAVAPRIRAALASAVARNRHTRVRDGLMVRLQEHV